MPPLIVFTSQELTAMFDLSHLACRLYIILRTSMDFQTSIVGMVKKISLNSLAENTEEAVSRGKGFQRNRPTVDQIRTAIDSLTRAGMIVKQGQTGLVFLLPMAYRASYCLNQTAQSDPTNSPRFDYGTPQGSSQASHSATLSAQERTPQNTPHGFYTLSDSIDIRNSPHIREAENREGKGETLQV